MKVDRHRLDRLTFESESELGEVQPGDYLTTLKLFWRQPGFGQSTTE